MKLSNATILEIINTLNKFKDQSGIMGFGIAKNLRILRDEIQEFEKIRRDLVVKYGKKDETDNYYIDANDADSYSAFIEEYLPVANCIVDVNLFHIKEGQYIMQYVEAATVKDYELLEAVLVGKE